MVAGVHTKRPRRRWRESLVTRQISLDEVKDAFEAMERQQSIRTVITS